MRPSLKTGALAALALLVVLGPASRALAGGFYLAPRGTRPLSRGGAYVAGVEDVHALWYNPAGLAWAGDQLTLDLTLSLFEASYTRIDGGGNPLREVTGHHTYLPIPTVGGTFSIDELPEWTFGLSVQAPNSALMAWPDERDAPQRYSLLSLEGSLLASVAAGAAWRPIEELSIGLSGHLLVGNFDATVALSACDGVICSFPEDPEYDGIANIRLPSAFPFFVLGTTVDLDVVKIGASVATPFNLEGTAAVNVRPPPAAAFDGAEVVNRRPGCNWEDETDPCRDDTVADAQLEFPWVIRLGVEVRPVPELRIEGAVVWETWSVQDAARIDPQDVWIEGALGGGLEYQVGPLDIPRNMNDTVSVRLGGAYTIEEMVTARLGVSYENGAFSDEYLTALTIDSDKVIVSGGAGIRVTPELQIDVLVGYLWMASRSVRNSLVPQPNPIRPPASEVETIYIGNGDYSMGAPFFGLSVTGRLDRGNIRGPGEGDEEAPSGEPGPEPAEGPAGEQPWYERGGDEPAADEASGDGSTEPRGTEETDGEPD
ncbi:MAG TPA: outer membrane protein transport protein [Sandaracinaceae bacterium LLY-WYZ-13_1]|nr:outer membrane protein transport protein [Sandaracinaceae bacterium LLY-WYZ-13_1]